MKRLFLVLMVGLLLASSLNVLAMAGVLKEPSVAMPEKFPEEARKQVMAALNRKDCHFLGGNFVNWFTTLRYTSDTKALNLFLDELAHIPGVSLHVSFVEEFTDESDWQLYHDGMQNSLQVRISMASKRVKLEDLYIPDIHGVNPTDEADSMVMLSYQDFDQKLGHGWREFSGKKEYVKAAEVITSYIEKHEELDQRDLANLHFHAAQCFSMDGEDASIVKALEHLQKARVEPEPADLPVKWNDYVSATEAFLKKDLKSLKAAREKIARGPKMNGEVPNLNVVDRLIANFGKPYAKAY